MEEKFAFFGYGALASRARVKEIIGRDPGEGKSACIHGYNLAIQILTQVPEQIRNNLRYVWGDNFEAYTLRKGSGVVRGTVWELSEGEFNKIQEWNLVGLWRESTRVTTTLYDGKTIVCWTEKVPESQPIQKTVDGINYEAELNPAGRYREKESQLKMQEQAELEKWRLELEKIKRMGYSPVPVYS